MDFEHSRAIIEAESVAEQLHDEQENSDSQASS